METLPAVQEPKEVIAFLDKMKGEFNKALGEAIPVEYFMRLAITAMRKNPLLFKCTKESVLSCLMDCAQVRLVPDSIMGEAYLIPFRKGNDYEATLIVGYRGLVKLVRRSGNVTNVYGGTVYTNDFFALEYGTNRKMIHRPKLDGDRGKRLGAVGFIGYGDEGADFIFCDAAYIEKVKTMSRGSDRPDSPWNSWTDEMWAKTALRRVCKTANLSPEAQEAVAKSFDAEGAIDIPSIVEPAPPAKSALVPQGTVTEPPKSLQGASDTAQGNQTPTGQQNATKRKPGPKRPPSGETPPEGQRDGGQTEAQAPAEGPQVEDRGSPPQPMDSPGSNQPTSAPGPGNGVQTTGIVDPKPLPRDDFFS